MGILNITPDSFYDGGSYTTEELMLRRAHEILDQGADMIDIGAVSSRPGAILLPPEEERDRLVPAIKLLRSEFPDAVISVDTCYSLPAEAAINSGADIINDISGGQFDPNMIPAVAKMQVPYILMHTRGLPGEMQRNTDYNDIIQEISSYFSERLEQLYRLGGRDIILDPGFGFAKTLEQNYFLMNHLDDMIQLFKEPFLVGISRKSMIYKLLGNTPKESLNGTTFLNTISLEKGAAILRVHDVAEAVETVQLHNALHNPL
ncbi:MAG: dihydropteroate synthase [Bacteroidales bacterium]|nr:dihydropteroate synthase [Bacteroidales bacterium]